MLQAVAFLVLEPDPSHREEEGSGHVRFNTFELFPGQNVDLMTLMVNDVMEMIFL